MALVFIHQGYSPYMEFTLRQARAADPDAEIVLLGDEENDRFPFVRHVDTSAAPYREAADEIAGVYRHLSTNREGFERACFERWYLLRMAFRELGLARAFVLDTDVMLYATEAEVLASHIRERTVGIGMPEVQEPFVWVGAPHASYWTPPRIDELCAFTARAYAPGGDFDRKWAHHRAEGIPGGVCDMTALYLYAREFGLEHVANPLAVAGGAAFDHNLNVPDNVRPDEYAMQGGHKLVRWDGVTPSGETREGERVRWYGLHLQGHAKARIPEMYRGPAFQGQAGIGRALRRHFALRGVASSVLAPVRRLRQKLSG